MSYLQLLTILRARWLLALSVLAVVVGATAAVSLVLPKQYKSSASVVIDVKPDPVSAMIYGALSSPSFMATQVDIIKSDRVAQRVVKNLKLADNPQVVAQWQESTGGQGSVASWMADALQRKLEVQPSRESNVISITFVAPDPKFAAALANAFVQAYIETTLELRVDPARQYSNFFEVRAKEARDALEAAQAKVSSFQRDKGIIATDERLDVENARLNELSSQLVAIQAVAGDSASRERQVSGGAAERMAEVMTSPVVVGLKGDVARAESRLKELGSRFGDSHPQIIEAKASLAELQTRLAEESRRVASGVGVTNTINRQREGQIRAELEQQRAKVLRMKQVRDEGAVLVRDVENAQRTYDAVVARLTQTSLESQATQSNVNVLNPAVVPSQPSSPRVVLNTLVATFVGTMLAIGLAVLWELRDRRVRSTADLLGALNLPVLGVLPNPERAVVAFQRPPLSMKQRLVRQLSGPRARTAGSGA
jgi:polysaccharide biosynthesis transport protein